MKKYLNIIIIFLLFSACGFKVVNQSELRNYYILNVKTEGDKRISYLIKNNLLNSLKDQNKQPLDIELNIQKLKSIKEKNIKNEITKYQISINTIVKIQNKDIVDKDQIVITKIGEYVVSDQYSQTINNEKKLINILTNDLSEENQNIVFVRGSNKQAVGEQAARIRKLRKPNPYTGNGIKYRDEIIRRKAGKTAVGGEG